MDLTNEHARRPPPTPPPPTPSQTLQVTPDNVVELAVLFSKAADRLEPAVRDLKYGLRLDQPWLGDPVSVWIWLVFNRYFVDDENSFAKVVLGAYDQHVANAEALKVAAEQYGLADVLHAALDDGPKLPR